MRPAFLLDLPLTDYQVAWGLQRKCVEARRAGHLEHDLVILLEHPPVFTLGRRGGRANLLVAQEELDLRGIEVVSIERGGDITYHGPGQLVAYLILDLNAAQLGVRPLVGLMEAAMVRTAADWKVTAAGNPAYRGVWVGPRKLGSIGITIRRGITFHGLALNANTELAPFGWINPCGIAGCTMTSLARETGSLLPMDLVRQRIGSHLAAGLGLDLIKVEMAAIEERLTL
jgi:lipoate-protein ligase B